MVRQEPTVLFDECGPLALLQIGQESIALPLAANIYRQALPLTMLNCWLAIIDR